MRTHQLLACLGLVFLWCAAGSAAEKTVRVRCQIFEIRGNFQLKSSIGETIWFTQNDKLEAELEESITFFDRAEFQIWKNVLKMDQNGCYWNDNAVDFEAENVNLPVNKVKLIYPTFMDVKERGLGKILISSRNPYQFFVKRDDGLFELKEKKLPTGLDIKFTPSIKPSGDIMLNAFELVWRFIPERKKIEGVNLNVGEPILMKMDYNFDMSIKPGKFYGVVVRSPGRYGAIIVRFMAVGIEEKAEAETAAEPSAQEPQEVAAVETLDNSEEAVPEKERSKKDTIKKD